MATPDDRPGHRAGRSGARGGDRPRGARDGAPDRRHLQHDDADLQRSRRRSALGGAGIPHDPCDPAGLPALRGPPRLLHLGSGAPRGDHPAGHRANSAAFGLGERRDRRDHLRRGRCVDHRPDRPRLGRQRLLRRGRSRVCADLPNCAGALDVRTDHSRSRDRGAAARCVRRCRRIGRRAAVRGRQPARRALLETALDCCCASACPCYRRWRSPWSSA